MAQLSANKKAAKDGREVIIVSPQIANALELNEAVRSIMSTSEHLFTQGDEFTVSVDQQEQRIQKILAHPDYLIIVAKVSGKIVGTLDFMCGGQRRRAHQGSLGMSVVADYQGLGIGRMLLETLLKWAEKNPRLEMVRLQVHLKNKRAIALYESVGFQLEGQEVKGVKFASGDYDDLVLMWRSVT